MKKPLPGTSNQNLQETALRAEFGARQETFTAQLKGQHRTQKVTLTVTYPLGKPEVNGLPAHFKLEGVHLVGNRWVILYRHRVRRPKENPERDALWGDLLTLKVLADATPNVLRWIQSRAQELLAGCTGGPDETQSA